MLQELIVKDMLLAMKSQSKLKLSVLRMALTVIKNKQVEKKSVGPLSDADVNLILNTMIKQRKDSIDQFTKGNRSELAAQELAEIKIIEAYLPKEASLEQLEAYVNTAIECVFTNANIGDYMKFVKMYAETDNLRIDAKVVSELIKKEKDRWSK